MICYKDIYKAVNNLLKKLYPTIHRYGNDTKDKVVTPYFFVELVPTISEHETKNSLRRSCNIYINYIQKTYDQADQMSVSDAFFDAIGMTLDVQDDDKMRHITISNYVHSYTGQDNRDLQISFKVEWYTGTVDTSGEPISTVDVELSKKEV